MKKLLVLTLLLLSCVAKAQFYTIQPSIPKKITMDERLTKGKKDSLSEEEVLADLPAPTHAFIGGSSGSLEAIIRVLREKNPGVRIVVNCITLETVSEVLRLIRSGEFRSHEIVSVCTARSKEAGTLHMMMGENPVYICTLQN